MLHRKKTSYLDGKLYFIELPENLEAKLKLREEYKGFGPCLSVVFIHTHE
jgi:hypothetical protein